MDVKEELAPKVTQELYSEKEPELLLFGVKLSCYIKWEFFLSFSDNS